jgi:hypothetical protein
MMRKSLAHGIPLAGSTWMKPQTAGGEQLFSFSGFGGNSSAIRSKLFFTC